MPAHLVEAAGPETHRQGAIWVLGQGLAGMEQECGRIAGYPGVEPQDHLDGRFLEGAERTLRVALQIERPVEARMFPW